MGAAWNQAIQQGIADPNPYDGITPGQLNLWAPDNYHGSAAGYYLEALTIFGNVTSISQDRLMDEATKQPYFLALIKVDTAHIPEEFRSKLTPGLNAEIILPTGERTVLAYLIDPLRETLRKTFREK